MIHSCNLIIFFSTAPWEERGMGTALKNLPPGREGWRGGGEVGSEDSQLWESSRCGRHNGALPPPV